MEMLIGMLSISLALLYFVYRSLMLSKRVLELQNLLAEQFAISVAKETQASDDFVKFLSESRDWAFDYIESVQAAILKFSEDIRTEINWFDTYSDTVAMGPNYNALLKISEAYKELMNTLPEVKDQDESSK